jgi:hypothetical protein
VPTPKNADIHGKVAIWLAVNHSTNSKLRTLAGAKVACCVLTASQSRPVTEYGHLTRHGRRKSLIEEQEAS